MKNEFLTIVQENERFVFGFTEIGFPVNALANFLQTEKLIFLKQVHSNVIRTAEHVNPGNPSGDGLILHTPGFVAVIQTADCVPLFFGSDDGFVAGILHVGWRGLHLGIEGNLIDTLVDREHVNLGKTWFFMGPAIERDCYPVGEQVRHAFQDKHFAATVFSPLPDATPARAFLFDLKRAISLSLQEKGIRPQQISDSRLCTFCLPDRFPSYRRDNKTGKRIYNFIKIKN